MSATTLPTWLVSSPHRRTPPDPADPSRRPHGTHHARRVGEPVTACGVSAVGWPYFWDLPFGTDVRSCCPTCLAVVRTT